MLITRPIHQQSSLLQSLELDGARTVSFPVMQIDPISDAKAVQKARSQVQNLDQFQWLIFISTNAASLGVDLIEEFWPQFPTGVQVAAIGRSTAAVLTDRLYLPVLTPLQGWDSEKLLAMPEMQAIKDNKNSDLPRHRWQRVAGLDSARARRAGAVCGAIYPRTSSLH